MNSVKKQLDGQIEILNNELSKTSGLSSKLINLERENRDLQEEISRSKLEIQNLNFRLNNSNNESNQTKQMIRYFFKFFLIQY